MKDEKTEKLTCKEQITTHLFKQEERDWAWLSRKTDIPYGTIYGIFVQNTVELTQERLNLINHALKSEFTLDVPEETTTA